VPIESTGEIRLLSNYGADMKQANTGRRPRRTRRIAGHAQQDHILDPYQAQQKLNEGTVCRQCGAVYHDGRWQWMAQAEGAHEALCAACRRINDKFPAGVVTLRGDFAKAHKEEMVHLARHQEEAEKNEHPLNRIISIEEDVHGIVMTTTDIHLPRRIGEAVKRAFHGEIEAKFEENGYFVRVDWMPAG
jgi:NMD protein affecting ribosome stability and mRNA decay